MSWLEPLLGLVNDDHHYWVYSLDNVRDSRLHRAFDFTAYTVIGNRTV
jgi:hypothetical protein